MIGDMYYFVGHETSYVAFENGHSKFSKSLDEYIVQKALGVSTIFFVNLIFPKTLKDSKEVIPAITKGT